MTAPKTTQEPEEWSKPLPAFRKDIKILKGPDDSDGAPTYSLYDPIKGKYYRLSWYEASIFEVMRPGMTLKELAGALQKRTAVKVTPQELQSFFWDATQNQLLDVNRDSRDILKEYDSKKMNPFMWALFHYLYVRIPLFHPDKFLGATLKYVRPLASNFAFMIYLLITGSGLVMLLSRFDEFINTFTYFFNWEGLIVYSLVIFLTKIFHELGHAYTAKNYGVHVPVMGVALIILWPVLFTDVTDSWKLTNRRQRFAISFAGIVVELVIAGIATWGWILSSPGVFQSACFILASVTWISSLLVNLNPLMRFDGYYLLSDLWGVDNLQIRAFAMARWKLRKMFLGLDFPPPEDVSKKRMIGMVVFSVATWIYRFTLYISIALIVYLKFTKVLGIILFIMEIIVFIVWPIFDEIKQTIEFKKYIKFNRRLIATIIGLSLLVGWFIIPLPHTLTFTAISTPIQNQIIYVPLSARVEGVFVKKGDKVKAGQTLVQMQSYDLDAEIDQIKSDMNISTREITKNSIQKNGRQTLAENREELKGFKAKLEVLLNLRSTLTLRAGIDGTVYDWDNDIKVNQNLTMDAEIGKIAPLDSLKVIAFVPEHQLNDIHVGMTVEFSTDRALIRIPGVIKTIRPGRDVALQYKQLASVYGGNLPTKQKASNDPKLYLVESFYIVDIDLEGDENNLKIGETGTAQVHGRWSSHFMNLIRFIQKVLWRESGI